MSDFLLISTLILFTVLVLGGGGMLAWMATGDRGSRWRKLQARAMSPVEEIFHPLVHESNIIWEAQVEMVTPPPAAGDKPLAEQVTFVMPAQPAPVQKTRQKLS